MSEEKYKVGQTLWFASHERHRRSGLVKITSIGRKWLSLDNKERADKNTLIVDGGVYCSPGQCYLTQDEYFDKRDKENAWSQLWMKVNRSGYQKPPESITIESIRQAHDLLFPESKEV